MLATGDNQGTISCSSIPAGSAIPSETEVLDSGVSESSGIDSEHILGMLLWLLEEVKNASRLLLGLLSC
jgi:hypothetical protein